MGGFICLDLELCPNLTGCQLTNANATRSKAIQKCCNYPLGAIEWDTLTKHLPNAPPMLTIRHSEV